MVTNVVRAHTYSVDVKWTGNRGKGTASYHEYARNHEIVVNGKPKLAGSADPVFRGDASRYNPEELLVAAASACHMLWYLHLCADNGLVVTDYVDSALGTMEEFADGSGRFTELVLRPHVTVASSASVEAAATLHEKAHHSCFIANSLNFPVRITPKTVIGQGPQSG